MGTTANRSGGWGRFIRRRLTRLAVSLAVVLTLSFLVIQLIPGDPVRAALGPDAPVSLVHEREAQLGLDKPLAVQYGAYWKHVLTGNFGSSIVSDQSVSSMLSTRLPNTAKLVGVSLVLTMIGSIVVGLVFGVLTHNGRRRRTLLGFTVGSGLVAALPEFCLAVGLVYAFAVTNPWFPVAGADGWKSVVLPSLAISLGSWAVLARIVRSQTDVVLGQDYMRTARSKRLPARLVYLRHALPNLLTATLTLGGLQLGGLVAGSIVVENVFAYPGVGMALVQGIGQRDYPVVQGVLLILAAAVLLINLIVDIALAMLNPRFTVQEG